MTSANLLSVLSCLIALTVSTAAQTEPNLACFGYKQCNRMGAAALGAGATNRAIVLFTLQAGYAELADIDQGHASYRKGTAPSYPLAIIAYNNLAAAYARSRNYLQARLWCRVALTWDKQNGAALHNLALVEEKLKDWRWPSSFTGTYLRYAGRGQWESVCVEQGSADKVHVSFHGMRMGKDPDGTPASYGDFQANLALSGGRATYRGDADFPSCRVQMDFAEDRLVLKQSRGDCGFGYGVEASGTFERASTSAKCSE
jgi:tetratricopeptide (TPR) repeat protein